jgi:hypothetical protein
LTDNAFPLLFLLFGSSALLIAIDQIACGSEVPLSGMSPDFDPGKENAPACRQMHPHF